MKSRMYCFDCGVTDFAATRFEGSDALEGLGWVLGGLPGWVYCAWRHALRVKVCAHCGSEAMLRESRASRAKASWPAPPHFGTAIACAGRGLPWPGALREPRRRLWRGVPWLAAWLLGAFGLSAAGVALGLSWIAFEAIRALAWDDRLVYGGAVGGPGHCHAWDDEGRPLRIELF